MERHEEWVKAGEPAYDDDNLYPLAPGAYKTESDRTDSAQGASTGETTDCFDVSTSLNAQTSQLVLVQYGISGFHDKKMIVQV